MIGCVTEAIEIASWEIEYDDEHDEYVFIPEGWTYLGEGESRIAFLSPSGVVYKREVNDGEWFGANSIEYRYLRKAAGIPVQGWRVPEHQLYDIPVGYKMVSVMAMEFVGGEFDAWCDMSQGKCNCEKPGGICSRAAALAAAAAWGVTDIHRGNVRVQWDGTRVIIDAAGDLEEEEYEEVA
ncbi:hypothetical protein SEA_BILLNYE_213 [Streptomyces phage BillNye]|uniref:Serine/threonine kinase n=2 Tax=Wilnyevirus billnye TaxID=2560486 RepID=A0A2L1IW34_9CAUD|nr:hypothetical protein FDJ30_gp049 [Streptomyces phage BillNye]AVD99384.1 hypothetical protein SEA_BILLNYE_213 [Streptomyces phage BillNye]QBZ72466.1 hypothetical protein SEA_CIRCINUS_213 [Streptomyces phage Circinus]